jgi:A/G-specific adenine glycosylase
VASLIARGRRRSFQRRVLGWYAVHGRHLPWRKTRDPYAILVSEVLSHQTQISRVLPVYERLLGRYPTVTALAQAPLAEVKAITDPLGYKIRGQWLHSAALRVADRPGGDFPETMEELRSLPGVGRYTAGAVMNFAHHRDAPVLDTNVALWRHGRTACPHQRDVVTGCRGDSKRKRLCDQPGIDGSRGDHLPGPSATL